MKIAIRGGHNRQAIGARGLLDEVDVNREIYPKVIEYLKLAGHDVLDVTPGNCGVNDDLKSGVDKANSWGADYFASIHCNKAYDSYNGSIGSESCVFSEHNEAQRVVNNLAALGFRNRGQKIRQGLYELRNTKMKAQIIETFFLEATDDVALYNRVGADVVAKAIAEGIHGGTINKPTPPVTDQPQTGDTYFRVVCGSYKDRSNAEDMQNKLKEKGFDSFLVAYQK